MTVLKDINEMDDEGGLRFKGKAAKNKNDTLPMRPLMIHMRLTEINGGLVSMCSKQECGQTHLYYYIVLQPFYSSYIYIHAKYLVIFLVIFACIMWMVHGMLSEVETTVIFSGTRWL